MVVRSEGQLEDIMSVAYDLDPAVDFAGDFPVAIPERARPFVVPQPPLRLATVVALHAPSEAPPLRLTRRGVVVLGCLVAVLAALLVGWAAASAPAPAKASHVTSVTVRAGDTLWAIATRVAPDRDPRAEVDALRRANHLDGVDLVPGQVLRVP
jgi:nucleoid-associated protein YgaU